MQPSDLQIRDVQFQDAELLWHWANDATVRQNAFHKDYIDHEQHMRWFNEKLASPGTRMWVVELNGNAVAQIRYDRVTPDTAEISYTVAEGYRGRGLGTYLLMQTAEMAAAALGVSVLKGTTFANNQASVRSFVKSGFQQSCEETISGHRCYIFVRSVRRAGPLA